MIGAVATAALFGVLVVKHRRLVAGTVVRFTPEGVELADARGFRVRLRWPDISRIDVVDTQPADPVTGRPEVAIPLGEIDPLWERGPMGDWVRRLRPDLMR
ncbi:hypothetical protein [Nonomuraea sp. NPDC052265]|uniref:hypothetical protein n=1 Tax=Nonomuraea sp. NPDC052265 TaxID=3364374 RepID=UPI0037CB108E